MTPGFGWLFRMAWRDSRRSRGRLMLFMASIIAGVAALVAINGFDDNVRRDIDGQAQGLLGADLQLRSNQVFSDSARQFLDSLSQFAETASENNFASVVYFPKSGGTRLVQVRALEGNFPFYGRILTSPSEAVDQFQNERQALVDSTLMLQFDAQVGDSIKLGTLTFEIVGALLRAPGQNGITATVAAPIYIPLRYMQTAGLDQKGSRINRVRYYHFDSATDTDWDEWLGERRDRIRSMRLRYETVASRRRSTSNSLSELTEFLNLVGFVALLLGCVGVASAVWVYVKEKRTTVAVLRCLGASGWQASLIYLIQIGGMGLIGSLIGGLLGTFIQTILPQVLADFLPINTEFSFAPVALLEGILVGTGISILFALPPLLTVREVSPLMAIRASFESQPQRAQGWSYVVYALIGLFIFGYSFRQMDGPIQALSFTGGLAAAFLILAGMARLIIWAVRRFFPRNWNYLWRQALANLYRPNNQTLILMVSIGLGTALLSTLFFVQGFLLDRVEITDKGNLPNMVLFDIQSNQKEAVRAITESYDLPILQEVPIVTMRLAALKGKTRDQWIADTTRQVRRWALDREYRVTFRDSLIDTETLVEGEWYPEQQAGDPIYISVEEEYGREDLKVELGDNIVFDVQGVPIETVVGSFRKVDFAARVQTNFLVLFPKGVLENAPQFHVLITKVRDEQTSAEYQRELARKYPTISVVDLGLILNTLEDILNKVSFVVRFMALFSILTGLIVLAGSVLISRFQRVQESVLLRTLGANRRQVLWINALEYFLLGFLASLTGVLLALLSSWGLAIFSSQAIFTPNLLPIVAIVVLITSLTVLIGLLNSRGILNRPPLEVLRRE
ncbi:MAG: FtsX-like permease family protein [Bacteroidota bacterium]